MAFFTNLRIAGKILSALALLALLALGISLFASGKLSEMTRLIHGVKDREVTALDQAHSINIAHIRRHELWFQAVAAKDPGLARALPGEIEKQGQALHKALDTLKPLVGEHEKPAYDKIAGGIADYEALTGTLAPLVAADRDDEAHAQLARADKVFRVVHDALNDYTDLQSGHVDKRAAEAEDTATAASRLMLVIFAIGLVAVGALALMLVRRQITAPLGQMTGLMGRLADGDNSIEVPGTDRRDEIGNIARAVLVFRDAARAQAAAQAEKARADAEQKLVVDTLSEGLGRLAEGDLTADIRQDFSPGYAAVKANFNQALSSLRDLVGAVMESSASIRTGSSEIAHASEDLARRTEANAASLEETSAAINQMDGRLRAGAAAAGDTVARADGAIATVTGGREITDDAVQAMTRVSESAKGIDSVIEGLDKIAFQTRVLAMNAAVEAGRAGEAGRGFAVVADLVSALAMRAEEEAGRAREQLTATQTDIVAAVEMVQKVDVALAAISSDVGEVHALLGSMAADNEAQSAAVSQITTAVTAMDQSTQQNAAMVEQTSAASRNLSAEVVALAEQTARFKVGAGEVRPALRKPAPASRSAKPNGYVSPVKPLPISAAPAVADGDWASF